MDMTRWKMHGQCWISSNSNVRKVQNGGPWMSMGRVSSHDWIDLDCRTAIVEHGTPEKGLGRLAHLHVGCQNDDEIVDGLVDTMGKDGSKEKVNFVWGRLREMERARGWNTSNWYQTGTSTSQNGEGVNGDDDSKLQKATTNTISNLLRIYRSLAPLDTVYGIPWTWRHARDESASRDAETVSKRIQGEEVG